MAVVNAMGGAETIYMAQQAQQQKHAQQQLDTQTQQYAQQ